jgi:glycosyltransferase involved in cell wall biosynthesis
VRKLAPYLVDCGWDVVVYGRKGTTQNSAETRDPRVRTRVTRGIESKSFSTLTYGMTACLDAARRKPDVALVMNCANGFWLPFLTMRGVPTVVNVDGIEWERQKWGRVARAVFRAGARMTAKFATSLVFDAREIARRWKQEFERDGHFIPYGGDSSSELPLEPGLEHRSYVLLVARLVPENTIAEFFEAAKIIAKTYPVVIVGTSGYPSDLERAAAELVSGSPNVTWLGHVDDDRRLHSLWQHAGVYFHGHSVGGTNPALVQAMASGAPTVARDTPYNREVLGNAGSFTAMDVDAIAASIIRLMEDPDAQARAAEDARSLASSSYTWEAVCQSYEQALRGVVREP